MPFYYGLKRLNKTDRKRAVSNLKELRQQISDQVPQRTAEGTLLLGTWNIRNFDDNRFGHGHRLLESLYYIAETIAAFDVIAVQELTDDLEPLDKVMSILGSKYEYIVTDLTEGRSGNTERLGFIFNKDKVSFRGIAGELVLPEKNLISTVNKRLQFARTPFMCSFQAEWFKFSFATVHIYYGKQSKNSPEYARRVAEIDAVAKQLKKRADKEMRTSRETFFLVGDFNIDDFNGKTFDALDKNGFEVFRNKTGSNAKKTKFYDQISFRAAPGQVQLGDSLDSAGIPNPHGVLDLFETLFTEDDFNSYDDVVKKALTDRIKEAELEKKEIPNSRRTPASKAKAIAKLDRQITELKAVKASKPRRLKYYMNEWRTFQISDHFPLWVELNVNFSDQYLDSLVQ